jgi:hypothetical protein
MVGADNVGDGTAVASVVVVGSLQPNQPGVLHVEVVEADVDVVVVVPVVLSSRQPHQPGVLQVEVLVVVELVVDVVELVVVISEPLLRKNFHNTQS